MDEKDLEQWLDRMEAKQADQAKNLDRIEASFERLVAAQKRTHKWMDEILASRGVHAPAARPALRLVVDAQVETDGMARTTARTRASRRKRPAKG